MYDVGSHTRRYFIALAVVAFVSVVSFSIGATLIHEQYGYAKIINDAGRQRMLSQRVALYALLGSQGRAKLIEATQQMASVNEVLLDPMHSPALGLLSQQQLEIYAPLRKDVRDFVALALVPKPDAELVGLEANRVLLQLHRFTKHCEDAATSKILRFESIEKILFLLTIVIVVLEAIFIFRPLTRRLSASFKAEIQARKLAEAKEILMRMVIDNMEEALILTDSKGAALGISSKNFNVWFAELSPGQPLQSVLPEVEGAKNGVFEVDRGRYHFKGRIFRFEDIYGTIRQLVLIRDETLAWTQAEVEHAQARRLLSLCEAESDLVRSLRSDVVNLLNQLQQRPPNDTSPIQFLLGALAGLGFDALNQLCRRVLQRANMGEDSMELESYLAEEVERYLTIIESETKAVR